MERYWLTIYGQGEELWHVEETRPIDEELFNKIKTMLGRVALQPPEQLSLEDQDGMAG